MFNCKTKHKKFVLLLTVKVDIVNIDLLAIIKIYEFIW